MKSILVMGGFVALSVILASIAFGFDLGTFFVVIMILFASASILYDTSTILHHFKPTQHVAASLDSVHRDLKMSIVGREDNDDITRRHCLQCGLVGSRVSLDFVVGEALKAQVHPRALLQRLYLLD